MKRYSALCLAALMTLSLCSEKCVLESVLVLHVFSYLVGKYLDLVV